MIFWNVETVVNGLSYGWRIGVANPEDASVLQGLFGNQPAYMAMPYSHKSGLTDAIINGATDGYIAGPFSTDFEFPGYKLHLNPIFVIPKPGKSEMRMITNASWKTSLNGISVNDLIPMLKRSVEYVNLKDIVKMAVAVGRTGVFWVIDLLKAFFSLPIHKSDYKFTGFEWMEYKFIFLCVMMGLGSGPKIYTEFADAFLNKK